MLPGMGPSRFGRLLGEKDPTVVWAELVGGRDAPGLCRRVGVQRAVVERWSRCAATLDLSEIAQRNVAAGIGVAWRGGANYPGLLTNDPEPPVVIFSRGRLDELAQWRRVAVVGTRSCTRYGIEVARELGEQLASEKVRVISGLALGIDAAAHAGALAGDRATPVGVVGSGLDVVYPRANSGLWRELGETGLLISEAPMGARPERWRFPARNRIIAALAEVVVVVESHVSGGSLTTVDEALERGVPVMAVPGSTLSPASAGTNRLIADGAAPVCAVQDVFEALGMNRPDRAVGATPELAPDQAEVFAVFDGRPATFEQLLERSAFGHGQLALVLEELVEGGWLERVGLFYERIGSRGPREATQ